jgi:hypothetical protein
MKTQDSRTHYPVFFDSDGNHSARCQLRHGATELLGAAERRLALRRIVSWAVGWSETPPGN